jgi:methylenetetrahydrofolate reductase (NADPH)
VSRARSSGEKPAAHHQSALAQALADDRFVVTAELVPPVSTEPGDLLARAAPLRGLATAVNVTDSPGAKVHLSGLVAAHLLRQNGIEPILQMTCRDRNRLALQSDLLGALTLGIRNLMVLSGDDPRAGDQPESKPVFDLDARGLLGLAHRLAREHRLPPGTEIKGDTTLFLGAADVPLDPPREWEPNSLLAKLDSGARFVQTQFCMDLVLLRRYLDRLSAFGITERAKILVGIAPIPSARSARWMRERLFGTIIPDALVERLEKAGDPRREGVAICIEVLAELTTIPGVAGAHLMAPQNPSAIPEVIAAARAAGVLPD